MNRDQLEYFLSLGFDIQTRLPQARQAPAPSHAPPNPRLVPRQEIKAPVLPASYTPRHTRPLNQAASEPKTDWHQLEEKVESCQLCPLSRCRTKTVFGTGAKKARLMFVGEGPGVDEESAGLPFSGRSGQLLDKMIEAMGLKREEEVYLTNVVKCRPPDNRNPEANEISTCLPYLEAQIAMVNPEIIVALGSVASQSLLKTDRPIGKLRGNFNSEASLTRHDKKPISVMATYHPAFLLRNPDMKKPVWDDLKKVMEKLAST